MNIQHDKGSIFWHIYVYGIVYIHVTSLNVYCALYYRIFIVLMCVVAILWVPMVKAFQSGRLFNYMVAVEGYVGSPLGVLFILSIFSTRITETVIELNKYFNTIV